MHVLAQSYGDGSGGGVGAGVVGVVVAAVYFAAGWRLFRKAGQPGWAMLIPIYNAIVLLKIAQKPVWWLVLFLIPIVNFLVYFTVVIGIAKAFGKSTAFGVGLLFLSPIFC